ncbi:MAG: flagellar hook basal-body protein [Bacteroidetes bacterium]|nr:flagellar hook basal-body protein [Bacteroidota bacterium]
MIKGIYTAGRSLDQRLKNIDVIANNLANLNSTGYKREIPFSEVINQAGEVVIRKVTSQQQGEILQTSNPLDLAISGEGFFVVKGDDGSVELTRDGRFKLSEDGTLTDSNGKKVMGKNGSISLEDSLLNKNSSIMISKNGEVKVGDKIVDKIMVATVPRPSDLMRTDGSNFLPGDQTVMNAPENEFAISQGFLEESNTNPIVEMEAMISLNKEFETAQKVISTLDTSLGYANEIGKI